MWRAHTSGVAYPPRSLPERISNVTMGWQIFGQAVDDGHAGKNANWRGPLGTAEAATPRHYIEIKRFLTI